MNHDHRLQIVELGERSTVPIRKPHLLWHVKLESFLRVLHPVGSDDGIMTGWRGSEGLPRRIYAAFASVVC